MAISEHAESFAGLSVVDFEGPKSWKGPASAYRVRVEYEDESTIAGKLEELLNNPQADQLKAIVIGAWNGACEGGAAVDVISTLVQLAPRLPKVTALFLGDITYEECELLWIVQADVTPLLEAFPKLEILQVRGGNGLSFSRTSHAALNHLIVESGGLGRDTIREILLCDFPNLEHLDLMLGDPSYGFDGTVEDLQPVLSGQLYPRLRHLGLRDSVIVDEIAAIVVNSPIVQRIEVLDLSLGNMTEAGARSLRMLPKNGKLKRLDISHHYVPAAEVQALCNALPFEVVAEDPQTPDDEWRSIAHAE